MAVTRGFVGRRRPPGRALPPGQYDVGEDWPVLSAEVTPQLRIEALSVTVDGLVEAPTTWTWDQLQTLPASEFRGDIHCVTTWSKFDVRFGGVSVDTLLERARPMADAAYVLARSVTGYTTNIPLGDLVDGKAWVVWLYDGLPLTSHHGGPVRLLVPHLYLWKSAKWLERLTLLDHDQQGFWEVNGYHDRGDPWLEQRYQGD